MNNFNISSCVVVFVLVVNSASAAVIAVGNLQSCFNNGTVGHAVLDLLHLTFRRKKLNICASSLSLHSINDCSIIIPFTMLLQDSLDCAKKIVFTLSVENGRLYETEALNFNVACINSPTGECPCPCFYAEDPTCLCRDLRRVISVTVTKTPVNAVYSLSQPRMFNGKPDEVIISTCFICSK